MSKKNETAAEKREVGTELFGMALDCVCQSCNGSGHIGRLECDSCRGVGYVMTITGKSLMEFLDRHWIEA